MTGAQYSRMDGFALIALPTPELRRIAGHMAGIDPATRMIANVELKRRAQAAAALTLPSRYR